MSAEIRSSATATDAEPQHQLRQHYGRWLDEIDAELVGGAMQVAEALPRVTQALLVGDQTCRDDAATTALEVAERCRRAEEQGFLMLAREAPVSGDLRRLVSILRLVVSVERSASLLRHVADTLDRFDSRELPTHLHHQLEQLAGRSAELYRRGLDAWRGQDALAVWEIDDLDDVVDHLRDGLVALAQRRPEGAEPLLLGLLARYYERIADHGVLLAQHATFAATGERVETGP